MSASENQFSLAAAAPINRRCGKSKFLSVQLLRQATLALAALLLAVAGTEAASFTNLYNFTATSASSPYTNSDGAVPRAALALSGNALYGTAVLGGNSNCGTLFRLNTDGTGFTNLFNFNYVVGRVPDGGLVVSNATLYGTTASGGSGSYGTAFKVNTDGTGYSNFLSFTYSTAGNGAIAGLALSGNTVYGVTDGGGSGFAGTVFKVNTDGMSYSNLHSFAFASSGTNSDGVSPDGTLVLSGNTLYGTTSSGGSNANGTVFRVNTDGTGFTNLHIFSASARNAAFSLTNADGSSPRAGLVLSGNTLYGTARFGGSGPRGTVFKLDTDGTAFAVLHSFSTGSLDPVIHSVTNSDGGAPWGGLCLSGDILYGTTATGGSGGSGTVFQLNTNGTGFTVLYSFTPVSSGSVSTNGDGASPYAAPIILGNTLYGTTESGGTGGSGTVFSLTLASAPTPIPLSIQSIGGNAVLSWNDPASAFSLQAAPAVTGFYTNVAGPTSRYTNPITGSGRFFRLKSN